MLRASGSALSETFINKGQEGLTKFYSMFAENFKESDRVHAWPVVATQQQIKEWNHHPHSTVVTDTEDSNLDNEDSVMSLLIYSEESDKEESPSDTPTMETTPETGLPS